jgi:quercetin dioxygenase-like cupin family protein
MPSRRQFSACAICAVADFAASVEGEAQAAPGGLTLTILQKTELNDKYLTLLVRVEIDAGANVARHAHPGIESAYLLEGGLELSVKGSPAKT